MMRRKFMLCLLVGMSSAQAFGAPCAGLVDDLKAMKQAQQAILLSLAENHEDFASSLTELATDVEMANGKAPAPVIRSMKDSARAYRTRGEKAQKQAEKLDRATADLIEEFETCLSSK